MKSIVYKILLNRPGCPGDENRSTLDQKVSVSNVSLAGTEENLTWELTDEGLSVRLPETGLDEMAVVLKIDTTE